MTTLYRCGWTLAAGVLVFAVMHVFPPEATEKVSLELAAMAKTIGLFAEAVLEESCLHRLCCKENGVSKETDEECEAAKTRVTETRRAAIKQEFQC